jgi:hypothetical protein
MPPEDHPDTHEPKDVEIFVNTRSHRVPKNSDVTYEQVVNLAFPNPDTAFQYEVTYQRAEGNKSGTLTAGGRVKAKNGMIFDVERAVRS